ncbi:uncharacterized protein LOC130967056 [Arachis stenosperma]|uniref:uncharacterized protein LOC130967056 n=1 Tax=Arachis stenosperma TaxID=217475 RepID=UPI0025ABE508|nr:uncharacterized protein LOC130967056 [Arachis stenosperma]
MSTTQYELLNIETYVLRVHMNCQGCMNKVRKVLSKIKGVYTVEINAEQQTVSVTGNVNLSTLVRKLTKFRKHVEILDAGYNQEQVNENNMNQAQHIINDHSAYENQYLIPKFGRDQSEAEWYLNKNNGTRDVERAMINQHFAEPLFMDHVNNITNQGFSRVNENPTSESMNFQQYNPYHSHLGSQEWAWNHLAAPIGVYDQQLFPIANSYHPSKAIQQSYHNHLPYEINFY